MAKIVGEDLELGILRLKLEKAVRSIQDEKPSRRNELHVSDFTLNEDKFCARKLVRRYFEGETDWEPGRPPWVMYDGKERENKWKRLLEQQGLLKGYQPDLLMGRLRGHPDFIVDLGQGLRVLELTGFDPRTPLGMQSERVAQKKRQCLLYLLMTGYDRGIVLVENKGSNQFKLHIVERDDVRLQDLKGRIEMVSAWIDKIEQLGPQIDYQMIPGCERKGCPACESGRLQDEGERRRHEGLGTESPAAS